MIRAVPWVILGLLVLYRKTWGACDCPGLKRRLGVAHRETRDWQNEARYWRACATTTEVIP